MDDRDRYAQVREALTLLRVARKVLRDAGALRAAEKVRLAITSAGGALRHARLDPYRQARKARKAEVAP